MTNVWAVTICRRGDGSLVAFTPDGNFTAKQGDFEAFRKYVFSALSSDDIKPHEVLIGA